MPVVTNTSSETFFVPGLGRVLGPGESCSVADATPYLGHPLLSVEQTSNVEAPAPVASPQPAAVPTSSISQSNAPESVDTPGTPEVAG